MSIEYSKNALGKPTVRFQCPGCQTRLTALLEEAGSVESCPTCGQGFRVPGKHRLAETRAKEEAEKLARQQKAQQIKHEKAERILAKRASDGTGTDRINETLNKGKKPSHQLRDMPKPSLKMLLSKHVATSMKPSSLRWSPN